MGIRKGAKQIRTLRRDAVFQEVRERVMKNADKIVNAQLTRALGSVMVFEVVEVKGKDGKPRTEHVLVENDETIKAVLDTGEGANCSVEGSFYLVTRIPPETRAGDSLLDRTFGKAQQTVEVIQPNPEIAAQKVMDKIVQRGWVGKKLEDARKQIAEDYKIPVEQILIPQEIKAVQ